jgi:long-chain acyl-CoA synthetase
MARSGFDEKQREVKYPKELVFHETLRRNVMRFPDRLAVVFENNRYTYKEFNTKINRLANALVGLGVKKGEKVALFGHNSDVWLMASYAASKVGAAFIPMNFRLVGPEIEYIVNHNDSVVLFIDHPLLDAIKDVRSNLDVRQIVVMRGEAPEGMLNFDELLASGSDEEPDVDVWEGDMAVLAQTGGTTGKPKGVVHSHRSVMDVVYQISFVHQYREKDRCLQVMPVYSSAALAYDAGATLFHGGTLFMYPLPPFDPMDVLKIISREKINHTTMAPIMLFFILAIPEEERAKYDVSALRSLLSVGAPTEPDLREAALEYFGEIIYIEYSATEFGVATLLRPEEILKYPESCGRAALNMDVKIVDLDGNDLPRGEIGEVVVAGTLVSQGYYKNPEATDAAFYGRYMGIGDMGYMDEEGYVYVVDRKSDMVISGGMNIYPAEIEAVMVEHPKIMEVAIIGVPDDRWGESVKAVIILTPGEETSEEAIIEWCKGKMASYRVPKSIDFAADFPRTPAGKVQKKVLREKYWEGYERKI